MKFVYNKRNLVFFLLTQLTHCLPEGREGRKGEGREGREGGREEERDVMK